MPKVSYLIALYNKEKFILDAIQSVLDDCSEEYEIEICIVDDGSQDNSLDLVIKNHSENKKIKIGKLSENRGKNAAYNAAFKMSTGDFISLLGADDEIIKDRTKILLKECSISGKSVYGGLIKYSIESNSKKLIPPPKKPDFHKNIIQNSLSGGCVMIHRSHAELLFPIPEELSFEDWWISFQLLRLGLAKTIKDPVLIYKIHKENDCGTERRNYYSTKKDYERHRKYLAKFKPYLISKEDNRYLDRSIAIRDTFMGARRFKTLASRPFDKTWVSVLLNSLIGSRITEKIKIKINKFF